MKFFNPFKNRFSDSSRELGAVSFSKFRSSPFKLNRKAVIYFSLIVFLFLLFFAIKKLSPLSTQGSASSTQNGDLKAPIAIKEINHLLSVPIKDSKDAEVTKVKYLIQNAELRREILVKGKKGSAVEGRIFLVFNLKLVNDYNKPIEINTKDFVRLSVGDNPELFAPSIHNDPVTLQAISTQPGRVGFTINTSDKTLKLHVGEINGEKTTLDINF